MVATSRAPGPLHGVTALVTGALVGTGQQNALRSKLASLGANVVGRFCKAVTHVVVLRCVPSPRSPVLADACPRLPIALQFLSICTSPR